jgi:hypothetical protein
MGIKGWVFGLEETNAPQGRTVSYEILTLIPNFMGRRCQPHFAHIALFYQ